MPKLRFSGLDEEPIFPVFTRKIYKIPTQVSAHKDVKKMMILNKRGLETTWEVGRWQ